MANRQARPVALDAFKGQGRVAADLPGPPAASGAAALTDSIRQFDQLSAQLSGYADKAAVREGGQAGALAALEQGDNLKLRRDGTLAGEAYDKAAIDTYAGQVEVALRNDMFAAAEKHPKDPAGLAKALDGIRDQYAGAPVFADPLLRASFEKRFADLRFPYEKAALRARDDELRRNAADAQSLAIETARRDATRAAYTFGDDPEGDRRLAAESGRIKRLTGNAVTAGYITPAAGERLNRAIDGEIAVGKVLGTFDRLKGAEDKRNFIDALDADYKAGRTLASLDGDAYARLRGQMERNLRGEEAAGRQTERELKLGVQSIFGRLLDGYGVTDQEWSELDNLANRSNAPAHQQALAAAKAEAATVENWWAMKPAELQAHIAAEEARLGKTPSPEDLRKLANAKYVLNAMVKQADQDLIGFAERTGRIQPTMLTPQVLTNPALIPPAFAKRRAAAEEAAASTGLPARYFTPNERAEWAAVMNAGGENAAAAATAMIEQWGPKVGRDAIREVAPKASVMAHAADVAAAGGSPDFMRDVAASLAMRGLDKYKPVDLKRSDVTAAVRGTYGTAFGHLRAEVQDTMVAAARAAYDARVRVQGVQTDIGEDSAGRDTFVRALQESAGARFVDGVQFGGIATVSNGWFRRSGYQVPVPPDIRADRFRDVVRAITPEDLARLPVKPEAPDGQPYPIARIHDARLVAVDGGYRLAMGDLGTDPRWIRGSDGKPFVLDLGAMRDTLKSRVPDAYRSR